VKRWAARDKGHRALVRAFLDAVRAGKPARASSTIATSQDQGALAALVIIATQISPNGASLRFEMTSAGRRFSARRSA